MEGILSVGCGGIVGFAIGLFGGGGSIIAVPLLIYVVGVRSPHVAIGTSALAVSANAFATLASHWRAGNVHWPIAFLFAASGIAGAAAGAQLGKAVDGSHLLFLFGFVMLAVAAGMFVPRRIRGDTPVRLTRPVGLRLVVAGAAVGLLSGFFGIGGGFLIVPAVMLGTGMRAMNAVGTSLVSIGAFGLTTAISYGLSDLIDWRVAGLFIAGGIVGGLAGLKAATRLSQKRGRLSRVFAATVMAAALFLLWKEAPAVFE